MTDTTAQKSPYYATEETLVDYAMVKMHLAVAPIFLLVSLLAGLAYSLQFLNAYPFPGISWLSPGRVRMLHTNAIAYAWLAYAFIGLLHYIIPKITGERVWNPKVSRFVAWAWIGIVGGTVVGLLGGTAQALEWGETPTWLDPIIVVVYAIMAINFIVPVVKSKQKHMYVSAWYIVAALIWTALNYVQGNFLVEYVAQGTGGAALTSMFIHNLVGLFVTPIGIASIYYLLPIVLNKPIYSHSLSLIGFWGLAFFYPLNSTHHYIFSPIPMWAQYAGIVASVGVHVVVYTVVYNFWMTMRGETAQLGRNIPYSWIMTGTFFYLVTCIQCALHVTLSFQEIIHFTDWVVAHAHMVLFGTFSFWVIAWIYYLIPKVWHRRLYSRSLAQWHFWLSFLGLAIMFVALTCAGLVQGFMWKSMAPFVDSVRASVPFWLTRSISGTAILLGQLLFIYNLFKTFQGPVVEGDLVNIPLDSEIPANWRSVSHGSLNTVKTPATA